MRLIIGIAVGWAAARYFSGLPIVPGYDLTVTPTQQLPQSPPTQYLPYR